jgi:hypothetical protein
MLSDEHGLRIVIHGLLAFIGVVMLGVGLAVLSGLASGARPHAAPPLAMVQPRTERSAVRIDPPRARSRASAAFRSLPRPPAASEPPAPAGRPAPPRAGEALLAVVIDDIGHNLETVRAFLALEVPLTYSVLPDVAFSRDSAHLISRAGRELIIHLPMEPFDYPGQNPGPHPLLLSLSAGETARRLDGYLETLPGAVGASNHMGSAYTYDEERMQVVQQKLAERRLFFLNSRTSATPVPGAIARRTGYPYLERDVFLDHDPGERAIENAFRQVVRRAGAQGRAIAIGHPHPQTLRVLRRRLPGLRAKGVSLAPLSDLLAP